MPREEAGRPVACSSKIVQAPHGSAAHLSVTEMKWLSPKPVSDEEVAEVAAAEARLVTRPVDAVPSPAPLPTGPDRLSPPAAPHAPQSPLRGPGRRAAGPDRAASAASRGHGRTRSGP